MKNYCQTINKPLQVVFIICTLGYLIGIVLILIWFSSYHGGNIDLVFQTTIYAKMLFVVQLLFSASILILLISLLLITYLQVGKKRKYYIRNYGKFDFFISTLKLNVLIATVSSGLVLCSYFTIQIFNALILTELRSYVLDYKSPSIVEYLLLLITLVSVQLIITYIGLSIKDRFSNNLNKYKRRSYKLLVVGGYLIRVILIGVLFVIMFKSQYLLSADVGGNLQMILDSYFRYPYWLIEVSLIGVMIVIIIDYYNYYKAKVIG